MAEESSSKVQVYIYDLSMGLAAQLSPLFLGNLIYIYIYILYYQNIEWNFMYIIGKQINGIW